MSTKIKPDAPAPAPAPALKEIFNKQRIRHIAEETSNVYGAFDAKQFMTLSLRGLDQLSVMQRVGHLAQALHATLPEDYAKALRIVRDLAPRLNSGFVTLILPEYVARYGADDFDSSMDALKDLTVAGSSEFAIRHFLRSDLKRTLKVMQRWSKDRNEHVRRLASEGSRPRLPWSFRLEAMVADPSLTLHILENLNGDSSLYVRKSVANHLNDIGKDHPAWLLDRIESWPLENAHTAWIAKHALRSLIKKGDKRALTVIGAGAKPAVNIRNFTITPASIRLGASVSLAFEIESTSKAEQRLVIDYAIHYVKKSGARSAKVFKLQLLTLGAGSTALVRKDQHIRDLTTRVHYFGRHEVEIFINGDRLATGFFDLLS